MRTTLCLTAVISLTACSHTSPFTPASGSSHGPFVGTNPFRLTYNIGLDAYPSWLPGGQEVIYTQERIDRPNDEWCLSVIPASGGAVTREVCGRDAATRDSQITFAGAVEGPDGELAYDHQGTVASLHLYPPTSEVLVLASDAAPLTTRLITRVPFFGPNARPIEGVASLLFLHPGTLLFVGQHVAYRICAGCATDTIRTGLEIDRWDASTGMSAIPNTDQASSVAVVGADTLYFTRNGDSRVFRLVLPDTSVQPVFDFGGGTIVRDVSAAAGRLAVVAGGHVSFGYDSLLGLIQIDRGGLLYLVDLAGNMSTALTLGPSAFARRPQLSPDGTRVVFEQYPFAISSTGPDTVFSHNGDLWTERLP